MALTYMNPLGEIRQEINRLFTDFDEELRTPLLPSRGEWPNFRKSFAGWLPPVEISETEKELLVCVAVPGIRPEAVNVEVSGNSLVISGETRRETQQDETQCHRSEFQYGQFSRSMTLPDYVKGDATVAEYKNGVLQIRLPKVAESKRKKIPVKVV